MIHHNFLCSYKRGVNRTFGPLAHVAAYTCPSDTTGGTSPRFWYVTPPPPPPPLHALRAKLVAKGQQLLTIHMVAPKAPENSLSFPLPILSTLHRNIILDPNLDSYAHPNPQPTPNPTPKRFPLTLTLIKTEYWDRAGGGGNMSYDW